MRHLPNLITVIRLLLILPVGWFVGTGEFVWAFTLFVIAGVSDALDGALARGFGWSSRFGAIADPVADKLLVATAYVILALDGHLPVWLAVLVLGRDAVIVGGALSYHFMVRELELAPTLLGKINTLTNIVFVGLVLAVLTGPPLSDLAVLVSPGVWAMAALTLLSGADYVRIWSRKAAGDGDAGA